MLWKSRNIEASMNICIVSVVKFENYRREVQAQILLFTKWICACTHIWIYLPLQKVGPYFLILLYCVGSVQSLQFLNFFAFNVGVFWCSWVTYIYISLPGCSKFSGILLTIGYLLCRGTLSFFSGSKNSCEKHICTEAMQQVM